MSKSFGSSRVQECVSRLEAQATDYKFEQGRLLREEKVRMSRSCRQIETDKKPKWHNNMHRADCFQTQFFMPYKFMPKYKQEQLLFPERVLEKGNKRFFIKMADSSVDVFPLQETEDLRNVLERDKKNRIIENFKLLELNKILEDNDGRVKARRLRRKQENRDGTFVVPSGRTGYFAGYPGFLKEQQIPETELLRKTSLARNSEANRWRPTSRGSKEFSQTAKSQALSNFLITRPGATTDIAQDF